MDGASNVNTNFLKMAGVYGFLIENCQFDRGPVKSLCVDLVGCHDGIMHGCILRGTTDGGIQAKGGSKNIEITANTFDNCGDRGINIGGSTGLPYFRPMDAAYEAAEVFVYANTFRGCRASIAFAGGVRSKVVNNTILDPTTRAFRIVQESVDASRFEPCGNNIIQNNIIVFRNETASFYGSDPLFVDRTTDLSLRPTSPAIGKGTSANVAMRDRTGKPFASPPSIGAYEGASTTCIEEITRSADFHVVRCTTGFQVTLLTTGRHYRCYLYDLQGRIERYFELEGGEHHVTASSREYLVIE